MKKITYLLLLTFFLTSCASARPVIRVDEQQGTQTQVEERKESTPLAMGSNTPGNKIPATGSYSPASTTASASSGGSFIENPPATIGTKAPSNGNTTNASGSKDSVGGTKEPSQMISAAEKGLGTAETEKSSDETSGEIDKSESSTQSTKTSETTTGRNDKSPSDVIEEKVEPEVSRFNLFDYYPLIPNRRINLSGGSFGDSSLTLQYLYEERGKATAQIKQTSEVGSQLNVIQITPNQISDLYYFGEIPYRVNIIGWSEYEKRIILKAPLQTGTHWESTGLHFEIKTVDQSRIIKGEKMTVMDVEVSRGSEKVLFTYAVGIGLVSNDLINPDGSKTNIVHYNGLEEGTTDNYEIELFFPGRDGGRQRAMATLSFLTNEAVKDQLSDTYNQLATKKGYISVLGEKTKIQFVFKEGNVIHLDLNEAFISSINRAPELEDERIQCLVNSISKFYQAEGVILTINDQRYESNHRKIEEDEILTPDYQPQQSE